MMAATWLLATLVLGDSMAQRASSPPWITVASESLELTFVDEAGFPLQSLGPSTSGPNLKTARTSVPLWTLQLLNDSGSDVITSLQPRANTNRSHHLSDDGAALDLTWSFSLGPAQPYLHVNMSMRLKSSVALVSWAVSREGAEGGNLSVFRVDVSLGGLTAASDDTLFYPHGYGVEFPNPCVTTAKTSFPPRSTHAAGPSQGASMQFMALGGGSRARGLAVYFGAHDPEARLKTLSASASDSVATLAVSQVAENAGVAPLTQSVPYEVPFPIAIGVIDTRNGSVPLWTAASSVYRSWAVLGGQGGGPATRWTRRGPIAARRARYPDWLAKGHLWFNTGWQCKDVFNGTQGDPSVVLSRAMALRARLGLNFSLHWYEWQQGPDPNKRYRFDTHYPDYFPPRTGSDGTSFADAVAKLNGAGIFVVPYINGILFDVDSESYKRDNGDSVVSRDAGKAPAYGIADPQLPQAHTLASGARMRYTCPSTDYWKERLNDTIVRLADEFGVAGVYVDMITSSAPKLDFGRGHNHSVLGGGHWWWTEGYDKLKAMAVASAPQAPLFAEGNAEVGIGVLEGQLTLWSYDAPLLSGRFAPHSNMAKPITARFAPAFPYVYGGYFVGVGAIHSRHDVAVEPDVAAARLASMFVHGTQMGWFSLGGVASGPDVDTKCGRMGTYDAWMDPSSDPLVAFVRSLVAARGTVVDYFVDGRLGAPPTIALEGRTRGAAKLTTFYFESNATVARNPGPFQSLYSSVWIAASSEGTPKSVCLMLVGVRGDYTISAALDMQEYGFGGRSFTASRLLPNGSRVPIGTFTGNPVVSLNSTVAARSVQLLELVPVTSAA